MNSYFKPVLCFVIIVCLVGFLCLGIFGTSQFLTYDSGLNLYYFNFRSYVAYLNNGALIGIDKLRGLIPFANETNFFTIVYDIVVTILNINIFAIRLFFYLPYNIMALLGLGVADIPFMAWFKEFLSYSF